MIQPLKTMQRIVNKSHTLKTELFALLELALCRFWLCPAFSILKFKKKMLLYFLNIVEAHSREIFDFFERRFWSFT